MQEACVALLFDATVDVAKLHPLGGHNQPLSNTHLVSFHGCLMAASWPWLVGLRPSTSVGSSTVVMVRIYSRHCLCPAILYGERTWLYVTLLESRVCELRRPAVFTSECSCIGLSMLIRRSCHVPPVIVVLIELGLSPMGGAVSWLHLCSFFQLIYRLHGGLARLRWMRQWWGRESCLALGDRGAKGRSISTYE